MAHMGGDNVRFRNPQPDTSLHCETTDTGLVHRAVCLLVLTAPTNGWPEWRPWDDPNGCRL